MDSERVDATYEGQVELLTSSEGASGAVLLGVELRVTTEGLKTFDSVLPGWRSWGGEGTLVDRTNSVYLAGRYEVVLPSGDRGEAWVSSEITQDQDERELLVSIQGIGRAPWWPAD